MDYMRMTMFTAALLASAISTVAVAQDRPNGQIGSGVMPIARSNSAERPIQFAPQPVANSILVVPVTPKFDLAGAGVPAAVIPAIKAQIEAASFKAAPLSTQKLFAIPGYAAVLLVGVEEADALKPTSAADVAGKAIQALRSDNHPISILTANLGAEGSTQAALGASLGQYRFDRLKSNVVAPPTQPITIVGDGSHAKDASAVASATRLARDLITTPANELYPETFVAAVERELKGVAGIKITVLNEADMRRLNMGSLLGVAQGSRRPARMLAIEYNGGGKEAPLALVGKGITFDTGGLSIKPATGMWEMKGDMSGAAAVVGAITAAAKRGAKANIVAVAVLTENMPGGNAQRPGDVVRTYSGQTIEMINADAEGRLVLVDANQWAVDRFKPSAVVNIATLTGAIVSALGDEYAGLFARDEALAKRLSESGAKVGEDLWRMPIHPSYVDDMESEIADIKNAREGGRAGAGTAAHFISYLTPAATPWAHIDMAAVDRADPALPTVPRGPRGYGVRLLDQLIRTYEAQ